MSRVIRQNHSLVTYPRRLRFDSASLIIRLYAGIPCFLRYEPAETASLSKSFHMSESSFSMRMFAT